MKKDNRFEVIYDEGNGLTKEVKKIIVDKKTGVNYLYVSAGYGGGLTALLDADGKPIVTDYSKEG